MSRPVRREACRSRNTIRPYSDSSSILNAPAVTIIGDTAHSFVYAQRLLKKGYAGPISILVEGTNNMGEEDSQRTNFVVEENDNMLMNLKAERIYYQRAGDSGRLHIDEDPDFFDGDLTVDFNVGSGVIGDFMSSYIVPRIGPWFDTTRKENLTDFASNQTNTNCLTTAEAYVMEKLRQKFAMEETNEFIVNVPSIATRTYTFVKKEGGKYLWRNLFCKIYEDVMSAGNVSLYTNITALRFGPGTMAGTDLITFTSCDGDQRLDNNVVVWKTNPYTFMRLSSMGGLDPNVIRLPTTYRATVRIPLNNTRTGGVDLTNSAHLGDMVTSIVTFCLNELSRAGGSCKPEWLCQVYTAREDLSRVNGDNLYADDESTILFVDMVSLRNTRKLSYNTSRNQCCVVMNRRSSESAHMKQAAAIVAEAYNAYTGLNVTVSNILSPQSLCQVGLCSEEIKLTSFVRRQGPLNIVAELMNHLYGGRGYPVAGKCM